MEDRRRVLRDEKPFSHRELKDEKYQVFFRGKMIKMLHGREAVKFSRLIKRADEYQIQLFLAKATGHFKHGNER